MIQMALKKLIILFLTGTMCGVHAKNRIPIGGIFHDDNLQAEIAFRSAIRHANTMTVTKVELVPLVKRVDRDDTFQLEKVACGLASEGVAAIFGPSSSSASKIVGSICDELGIPHFLANWIPEEEIDTSEFHQYTRNFFPDNTLYATSLKQIIADYEWKGFTVIYENNDSLERLSEILQIHNPDDSAIAVHQLPVGTDDYEPWLKEMKNSQEHRIIIDCSPENVMKLLKQAVEVGMMAEYESYIITSLDSHMLDFAELKDIRSNVTTLRMMNPLSEHVSAAIHEWRDDVRRSGIPNDGIYADRCLTESALYYDAVNVFASTLEEFNRIYGDINPEAAQCSHPSKWQQGSQLLNLMEQTTERGMTGRIIFDDYGRRKDFYMEILELNLEGFKKIATLDPKDMHIEYTRTEAEVFTQVSQSLQNKTLIVAARIGMPYLEWKQPKEGEFLEGNDRFQGYALDLIDEVAKFRGFNYKFEIVPDNAYGSYDKKKKKWDGLVKQLLDRKADLAICDLTITYERRTAVDFTMPFMTLGISILYSKPHKEPPGLFSFMEPLSLDVWLYMATAYLCMSILLYFLAMIAADDWESPQPVATSQANLTNSTASDEPEETVLETIWNMHNWIWLVAGSIMQQGCDLLPKAVSTRLTAGLWWFFALIVISSYTANLAAFLTMERMEESIENAEDLAKQNKIKYGAVWGGSTLSFFKESNFPTYQRMWTVMESASPSVFTKDNAEGIERVVKGNRMYAFLMESTSIEYYAERNCNLTKVGGLLDSKGYGIALPMDSPYRTHISQTILKMQEEGILHRLKQKWWMEENACDIEKDSEEPDTPELGMENVGGVFLVLLGGTLLAIVFGVMEFLWNINRLSVEYKITRWQAFKEELIFALDIRKTKKPVRTNPSERGSISNISAGSLEIYDGTKSDYHIGLENIADLVKDSKS